MSNSPYLNKSQEFKSAVDILVKNAPPTMNNANVQTAYYSCLLRIKHILFGFFSYARVLDNLLRKVSREDGRASHETLIKVFFYLVKQYETHPQNRLMVCDKMLKLKDMRVKASYERGVIDDETFDVACKFTSEVLQILAMIEKDTMAFRKKYGKKKIQGFNKIDRRIWSFQLTDDMPFKILIEKKDEKYYRKHK